MFDDRDVELLPRLHEGEGVGHSRGSRGRAPKLRLQREHATLGRIGGHHQHAHALHGLLRDRDGRMHHLSEDREIERRARIGSRLDSTLLDAQLAIHHLHEPPGDREADDGQRVAGLIQIGQRSIVAQAAPKDASRYAAAGVADPEMELEKVTALLAAELDANSAALRALDAAVEQCQHHLLDAARVTDDDAGHVGFGAKGQVDAFGAGLLDDHAQARLDTRAYVERVQGQLEVSGIEDVVEEPGDAIGAALGDCRKLALLAGRRDRRQHACGHHDGVELVAQLVPEVRQQLFAADG